MNKYLLTSMQSASEEVSNYPAFSGRSGIVSKFWSVLCLSVGKPQCLKSNRVCSRRHLVSFLAVFNPVTELSNCLTTQWLFLETACSQLGWPSSPWFCYLCALEWKLWWTHRLIPCNSKEPKTRLNELHTIVMCIVKFAYSLQKEAILWITPPYNILGGDFEFSICYWAVIYQLIPL